MMHWAWQGSTKWRKHTMWLNHRRVYFLRISPSHSFRCCPCSSFQISKSVPQAQGETTQEIIYNKNNILTEKPSSDVVFRKFQIFLPEIFCYWSWGSTSVRLVAALDLWVRGSWVRTSDLSVWCSLAPPCAYMGFSTGIHCILEALSF